MKSIVDEIIRGGEELSSSDRLNKVWVHSAIEFQRIYTLLDNHGRIDEGIYILGSEYLTGLKRYLERLKKIRNYYYEASQGEQLPEILRPPIVEAGEIIRIKREAKPSFKDNGERTVIHLTFTNCKVKHIEEDGRIIIAITDSLSPQNI